jgi:hypothetical protein
VLLSFRDLPFSTRQFPVYIDSLEKSFRVDIFSLGALASLNCLLPLLCVILPPLLVLLSVIELGVLDNRISAMMKERPLVSEESIRFACVSNSIHSLVLSPSIRPGKQSIHPSRHSLASECHVRRCQFCLYLCLILSKSS